MSESENTVFLAMTSQIVAAYVSRNSVQASDLPGLISSVNGALISAVTPTPTTEAAELQKPAVPVRKSIGEDFILCLEDGKKLKMLKRHLMATYGLTPDEYRAKWNLPKDYPMVAPAYAAARSQLAKSLGLGTAAVRKPKTTDNGNGNAKPKGKAKKAG